MEVSTPSTLVHVTKVVGGGILLAAPAVGIGAVPAMLAVLAVKEGFTKE